jgi:hypothetical protein
MHLRPGRVRELAEYLDEAGLTNRHRTETRQQYETVYGISPSPTQTQIETVFARTIQARSQPLSKEQYEVILDRVAPSDVLAADSRQEAFDHLYEVPQIGQKIANEFLRVAVDVLEVDTDWDEPLHVALDTNVVQALTETGAIELPPSEADRPANRIVNMAPESTPRKLIGYSVVQEAFVDAAARVDEPRIVFDELWTEHRAFISDPLLRSQSVFSDFLD